uniref:Transposase n=1 Tax=Steinernema glaseri TaxID=37863 RepID=A0A1I7Z7X0_9BILA
MGPFFRSDTEFLAEHMIEAMKKGLLRGWQFSLSSHNRKSYKKLLEAIVDLHGYLPPRCLWYKFSWLLQDVQLATENWKPFVIPGYHSISDQVEHWFRYTT